MQRAVGFAFISIAAFLLALCFTGRFVRPAEVQHPAHRWDRLDPGLYRSTPDYASLLRYARRRVGGTDEQKGIEILDIVSRRFVDSPSKESLLSSYPAFFAGFIDDAFRVTFSLDRILGAGDAGVCSQQSYVLVHLANDLGIRARQVGLNGHVVAELWYADGWHMFDPDYELFIRGQDGTIESVRTLALNPPLLNNAYGKKNPVVPELFESREDNTFVSYPVGAYFEWKTNVLLYVTQALDLTKWVFPLLFLLIGLMLIRSPRARSRKPTFADTDQALPQRAGL